MLAFDSVILEHLSMSWPCGPEVALGNVELHITHLTEALHGIHRSLLDAPRLHGGIQPGGPPGTLLGARAGSGAATT